MRVFQTLLFPLLWCLWLSGCDSHLHSAEAEHYTAALKQELERLGSCQGRAACPPIFWEAGGIALGPIRTGGVHLAVYEVADHAVVQALGERCRQLHAQAPQIPLALVIYSTPHPGQSPSAKPVVIQRIEFSS